MTYLEHFTHLSPMEETIIISKDILLWNREKLLTSQQESLISLVEQMKEDAKRAKETLNLFNQGRYKEIYVVYHEDEFKICFDFNKNENADVLQAFKNDGKDALHPLLKNMLLQSLIKDLVFFPDARVLEHFRILGLNKTKFNRFIPLKEIITQLNRLEAENKSVFLKNHALSYIADYVYLNAKQDLKKLFLEEIGIKDISKGNKKTDVQAVIDNIFKTRDYYGITPPFETEPGKQLFHNFIDILNQTTRGEEISRKILRNYTIEKRHRVCLRMVTKCWLPPESSTESYEKFFDLFSLVVKEIYWKTKEEWKNREGYAGRSYQWYRESAVKRAIRDVSADYGSVARIKII